jgi:DNA-binding response OmpR family regulator
MASCKEGANMNTPGYILIIDDETTLRLTLARILQQAGMTVTTAASGAEGLSMLAQQAFDLVYLDLRMPDMNGMEVLKAIHARLPEMPVILFTAQPDLHSAVNALRQGAIDYLVKTLQPQAFIERTQTVLIEQAREHRKREIQKQIDVLRAELIDIENGKQTPPEKVSKETTGDERFIKCGKLTLDLHTRRVTIGARAVGFAPATFNYLLALVHHAPNVVDYQTLVAEAQGYQANLREAQELAKWHIHHIRQAIEPDTDNPSYLVNVRGTGYRLIAD